MSEVLVITGQFIIILALLVDKYLYQKDMTNKLNDAIKAVMSRNIGEYLTATKPGKTTTASTADETIPIESLDNEAFDKTIKQL